MRNHFINGYVVCFDGKIGEKLEVEADADLECLWHFCEKSIVVASATAEPLVPMRERDAGDDGTIHGGRVDTHARSRNGLPEFPPTLDELRRIVHLAQFEGPSIDAWINNPFFARHTKFPEQIEIWLDDLGRKEHYCSCRCKFWMSNNHVTDCQGCIATVSGMNLPEPYTETFSEIRFLHRSDSINVERTVHYSEVTSLDSFSSDSRA